MTNKRIQYSLRALVLFTFVLAIPAWQIGKLRKQYFVEHLNVAELKQTVPTASMEYLSIAPKWFQESRFCPEWLDRVHSVDFIGLLEKGTVEKGAVTFSDDDYLSIESNLTEFRALENLLLWQTQVSDVTLKKIAKLSRIRRLDLSDCKKVTDAGIGRLIEDRPNLKITEAVTEGGFTTLKTISPNDGTPKIKH